MSVPDSYALPLSSAVTSNLVVPKRALAIGAHPDDVEFGCGGTLAKWAKAGCEIFHLVLTDGSKGTWDPTTDQAELVVTRQREQREAARLLGGTSPDHVQFLGWIDGELDSGLRQRWEVAYWIRKFAPDVVLGHDPWRRYRIHPDHRHAGFLTTDGIVAARDPKFFPEQQLAPHRPTSLLLWEADEPDHVEAIDTVIEEKLRALLAHESQYATTMRITADLSSIKVAIDSNDSNSSNDANGSNGSGGSSLDSSELKEVQEHQEITEFRLAILERAAEAGRLCGVAAGEAFKHLSRL